jgi:hypothetical protein
MALTSNLRMLAHDSRRVAGGLRRVWLNRWGEDSIDVCLAFLRAGQEVSQIGSESVYEARLFNPLARDGCAELIFDFYAHPGGAGEPHHLGFVASPVPLECRPVRSIHLSFDWLGRCELTLDSESPRPLALHGPDCTLVPGLWRVILVARDPETGTDWHRLEIVQRVEAGPL